MKLRAHTFWMNLFMVSCCCMLCDVLLFMKPLQGSGRLQRSVGLLQQVLVLEEQLDSEGWRI
jgi:arginine exporter protein ArgO